MKSVYFHVCTRSSWLKGAKGHRLCSEKRLRWFGCDTAGVYIKLELLYCLSFDVQSVNHVKLQDKTM